MIGGLIKKAVSWFTGGGSLSFYLGAALVLSVLLGWLFWSRQTLKTELAEAGQTIGALRTAYDAHVDALSELQAEIRLRDEAESEHRTTQQEIQKRRSARDLALYKAAQNDEEVARWLGTHMPGPVFDHVRP